MVVLPLSSLMNWPMDVSCLLSGGSYRRYRMERGGENGDAVEHLREV
jgi:hypothetical protein